MSQFRKSEERTLLSTLSKRCNMDTEMFSTNVPFHLDGEYSFVVDVNELGKEHVQVRDFKMLFTLLL